MDVRLFSSAQLAANNAVPKFFLEPISYGSSLSLLFAGEGVGKSYISLYIAAACAGGNDFLHLKAHRACKVFYIDGEMSALSSAKRHKLLQGSLHGTFPHENLSIACLDSFTPKVCPQITSKAGQHIYDQLMKDAEFIIIDNLGCLAIPQPGQDEVSAWAVVQEWLMRLRAEGRAVMLLHHAGKSGDQLGTIRKMQPLDIDIKLIRPMDFRKGEGLRCNFLIRKDRDCLADSFPDVEIKLDKVTEQWSYRTLEDKKKELVLLQTLYGASAREIAAELGLNPLEVREIIHLEKNKSEEKEVFVNGYHNYGDE